MISEHISNDIPPQMKILNMVIPILMHFCCFVSNWSIANSIDARYLTICDVINETFSDSIWQDILYQIFDVIQSDAMLQNQVHYS